MVKGPPGSKRNDILPSATHSQRSPSPLQLEPWLEPRCESLKEPLPRAAGKQMMDWGPRPSAWLCALCSSDLWGCTPAPQENDCFLPLKISTGRERSWDGCPGNFSPPSLHLGPAQSWREMERGRLGVSRRQWPLQDCEQCDRAATLEGPEPWSRRPSSCSLPSIAVPEAIPLKFQSDDPWGVLSALSPPSFQSRE